jgi:hypothetical protein
MSEALSLSLHSVCLEPVELVPGTGNQNFPAPGSSPPRIPSPVAIARNPLEVSPNQYRIFSGPKKFLADLPTLASSD